MHIVRRTECACAQGRSNLPFNCVDEVKERRIIPSDHGGHDGGVGIRWPAIALIGAHRALLGPVREVLEGKEGRVGESAVRVEIDKVHVVGGGPWICRFAVIVSAVV